MSSSRDPGLPDRPAVVVRSDPGRHAVAPPNDGADRAAPRRSARSVSTHGRLRVSSRAAARRASRTRRTGVEHAPSRTPPTRTSPHRRCAVGPRVSVARVHPPPPGPPTISTTMMDNHRYPSNILQHFPFRLQAFARIDLRTGSARPPRYTRRRSPPRARRPHPPYGTRSTRNPIDASIHSPRRVRCGPTTPRRPAPSPRSIRHSDLFRAAVFSPPPITVRGRGSSINRKTGCRPASSSNSATGAPGSARKQLRVADATATYRASTGPASRADTSSTV